VTHSSGALSLIDALFTATSAVCVTGLTTVNPGGFNLTGQLVILLLIQLGGIGIMTLTASILVSVGRNMSFDNTLMISNVSENFPLRQVESMLKTVIFYTFFIEAIGAALLTYGFLDSSKYNFSLGKAAYLGIFHSISAFCNAGFSTFDENLIGTTAFIKIVISVLIIFGGLGIYVIYDLTHSEHKKLKIHTRLVLITSLILIIFGTLAFWLLESGRISWVDAYFQSVSARTCGFNSVDMGIFHPASLAVFIVLMMIGASPGSTGGGMKTTTAAIIFMSIYNTFKGNNKVLMFNREIPTLNVLKAYSMMFIYILIAVVATVFASATSEDSLQSVVFEVVSALGTVGLSLGLSAKAGVACKLVLILCMFVGRIGPFTIFLFLLGKEKKSKLNYPQENVIIG
jgi:trk system potassium uptake protein TrkH